MKHFLSEIQEELQSRADPVYRTGCQQFFKESVCVIGVRTPIVRRLAAKWFAKKGKTLPWPAFVAACEQLLTHGTLEEGTFALAWMRRRQKELARDDAKLLERWIASFVTNWAICDDFCTHIVGYFFGRFPQELHRVDTWAASKNLWFRRAAAVSLIPLVREGKQWPRAEAVAKKLLFDKEDLVQKGYGWLLKEASIKLTQDVYAFVIKHKDHMPRTALRYAVERYPQVARKRAMA